MLGCCNIVTAMILARDNMSVRTSFRLNLQPRDSKLSCGQLTSKLQAGTRMLKSPSDAHCRS